MPQDYSPTATFLEPPFSISKDDDSLSESNITDIQKSIYDKLYYLNEERKSDDDYFTNLLLKLGISIANRNDSALPTYASAYLLTGNKTHHNALELLDTNANSHNTKLTNINTNCGGNVYGTTMSVYSSTNYITNGDSHHVALGKLDNTVKLLNIFIGNVFTLAIVHDTKLSNIGTILGNPITATTINYATNYLVADDDSYKEVIEQYDQVGDGCRRELQRLKVKDYTKWLSTIAGLEGHKILFFSDTDDGIVTAQSTATRNSLRILVSGENSNTLIIAHTLDSSRARGKFWIDGDANFQAGQVTVRYNLIGSYLVSDMIEITQSDITNENYVIAPSAGDDLVIRLDWTGTSDIYEIYAAFYNA